MTAHTLTLVLIWFLLSCIAMMFLYIIVAKGYVVRLCQKVLRLFKRDKKPVNIDERFWGYYHKEPTDIF